jgi:hypothetical protein
VVLTATATASGEAGAPAAAVEPQPPAVEDHLLVRWEGGVGRQERARVLADLLAAAGATGAAVTSISERVDAVALPGRDLAALAHDVARRPQVALAGPDRVLEADGSVAVPAPAPDRPAAPAGAPNDPLFGIQWGLWNPGLPVGPTPEFVAVRAGVDVDVLAAWTVTRGSPGVRVGLLDTAVDLTHPDLRGVVVDTIDLTGGQVTSRDHGTAVASLLAARADDGIGMAGVAPETGVWSIAVFGGRGAGPGSSTISTVLAGFDAARRVGADVINASWVTSVDDPFLAAAIADASVPVVAASGNGGRALTPVSRVYPATYDLPNLLTVTAVGPDGRLPSFANRGADVVDLAAPGEALVAAQDGGGYAWVQGTSYATAHVTGALALARAVAPDLPAADLVDAVRWTSRLEPALVGWTVTGGMLDVGALVAGVQRPVCDGARVADAGFADVRAATDAATSINCLAELDLVAGRDGARFDPSAPATRAQVASMLAAVLAAATPTSTSLPAPAEAPFADVPAAHPHAPGIALLASLDIVRGDTRGRFHPDRPITAGQLAALAVRTYDEVLGTTATTPSRVWFDDTVATTHEDAIHRARDLGIVRGVDRLTFAPQAPRDRGQVAAVVAAQVDALARGGGWAW